MSAADFRGGLGAGNDSDWSDFTDSSDEDENGSDCSPINGDEDKLTLEWKELSPELRKYAKEMVKSEELEDFD